MEEIYWITRLDYVQNFFIAFLILTGLVIVVATIFFLCDVAYSEETSKAKRVLKWAVPSFAIALSVLCFIPSTKEGMLMYGIGGTIDYIKSNDKVKQIPDKAVDALIKWLDTEQDDKKGGEK